MDNINVEIKRLGSLGYSAEGVGKTKLPGKRRDAVMLGSIPDFNLYYAKSTSKSPEEFWVYETSYETGYPVPSSGINFSSIKEAVDYLENLSGSSFAVVRAGDIDFSSVGIEKELPRAGEKRTPTKEELTTLSQDELIEMIQGTPTLPPRPTEEQLEGMSLDELYAMREKREASIKDLAREEWQEFLEEKGVPKSHREEVLEIGGALPPEKKKGPTQVWRKVGGTEYGPDIPYGGQRTIYAYPDKPYTYSDEPMYPHSPSEIGGVEKGSKMGLSESTLRERIEGSWETDRPMEWQPTLSYHEKIGEGTEERRLPEGKGIKRVHLKEFEWEDPRESMTEEQLMRTWVPEVDVSTVEGRKAQQMKLIMELAAQEGHTPPEGYSSWEEFFASKN